MKKNNLGYRLIWLVTKDTNVSKLDGVYYNSTPEGGIFVSL